MSERGYGRGWSEPKAKGLARLCQIAREPATKDDVIFASASLVILMLVNAAAGLFSL